MVQKQLNPSQTRVSYIRSLPLSLIEVLCGIYFAPPAPIPYAHLLPEVTVVASWRRVLRVPQASSLRLRKVLSCSRGLHAVFAASAGFFAASEEAAVLRGAETCFASLPTTTLASPWPRNTANFLTSVLLRYVHCSACVCGAQACVLAQVCRTRAFLTHKVSVALLPATPASRIRGACGPPWASGWSWPS
jgi:hypothetical protein